METATSQHAANATNGTGIYLWVAAEGGAAIAWFPVVTLILGYVLKYASDYFQDERALKRDRETRESLRRESRWQRRTDFQRQTLLDLQDAMLELAQTDASMQTFDLRTFRESGSTAKGPYPSELNEKSRVANARTAVLASRVRDASVRELVQKFKDNSFELFMNKNPSEGVAILAKGGPVFVKIQERIGELLREIDSDTELDSPKRHL